jgi:hypothetical protein
MSVVQENEIKKHQRDNRMPDDEGQIIVQNNKWFVIALISMITSIILIFMWQGAESAADKPPETNWVLLYPDGSWRVEFKAPSDTQEFFLSTIEALLEDYIKFRYQQIPATIRGDYGKASLFMSPTIKRNFVKEEPEGFGAITKAGEIQADKRALTIKVEVVFFDHLSDIEGVKPGTNNKTQFIRTNVYVDELVIGTDGVPVGNAIRKIINLTWKLLDAKELKLNKQKFFLVNPIGLTILDSKETIDTTYNRN